MSASFCLLPARAAWGGRAFERPVIAAPVSRSAAGAGGGGAYPSRHFSMNAGSGSSPSPGPSGTAMAPSSGVSAPP